MLGPEITRRLPYYEGLKVSFFQVTGGAMFVASSLLYNYASKRPLRAAQLQHLAFLVAGMAAGNEVEKFSDRRRNAKVIVIEDYISKHPEDFPLVKPKKYKDVLVPWNPLR